MACIYILGWAVFCGKIGGLIWVNIWQMSWQSHDIYRYKWTATIPGDVPTGNENNATGVCLRSLENHSRNQVTIHWIASPWFCVHIAWRYGGDYNLSGPGLESKIVLQICSSGKSRFIFVTTNSWASPKDATSVSFIAIGNARLGIHCCWLLDPFCQVRCHSFSDDICGKGAYLWRPTSGRSNSGEG